MTRRNWSRMLHRFWMLATGIWLTFVLVLFGLIEQRVPEEWELVAAITLGLPLAALALGHAIAWAVRGLRVDDASGREV